MQALLDCRLARRRRVTVDAPQGSTSGCFRRARCASAIRNCGGAVCPCTRCLAAAPKSRAGCRPASHCSAASHGAGFRAAAEDGGRPPSVLRRSVSRSIRTRASQPCSARLSSRYLRSTGGCCARRRARAAALRLLRLARLEWDWWQRYLDHDHIDAMAAALTAWRYLNGLATGLGTNARASYGFPAPDFVRDQLPPRAQRRASVNPWVARA